MLINLTLNCYIYQALKRLKMGKKVQILVTKLPQRQQIKKIDFSLIRHYEASIILIFFFSSDISPLCYAKHLSMFKILEGVYCVYLLSNLCCSSNVFKSRDPFLKIEFYETILCSTVLFFLKHF